MVGRGFDRLMVQDYAIDKDNELLFINITKMLNCGEEYHLKIKMLQHDGNTAEWLLLFPPKGLFS